jgi:hypothetical protein
LKKKLGSPGIRLKRVIKFGQLEEESKRNESMRIWTNKKYVYLLIKIYKFVLRNYKKYLLIKTLVEIFIDEFFYFLHPI